MADLYQAQGNFIFNISKLKKKKNSFKFIKWLESFVDACANRNSHTNINFCRNTFCFDGNEVFNFTFDAAGECSYESVLEDMFLAMMKK